MMKGKIILVASLILIALVVVAFKPISFSGNPKRFEGKVIAISESGVKDAVLKFQNSKTTFYINRGFEIYNAKEINSFIGKTVVLYYTDGWTPLDPFNNASKNIVKINWPRL